MWGSVAARRILQRNNLHQVLIEIASACRQSEIAHSTKSEDEIRFANRPLNRKNVCV